MKIVLNRFVDALRVTGLVAELRRPVKCVKVTERKLTTSDSIGLVLLITSLLVLSAVTPIGLGSRKEND